MGDEERKPNGVLGVLAARWQSSGSGLQPGQDCVNDAGWISSPGYFHGTCSWYPQLVARTLGCHSMLHPVSGRNPLLLNLATFWVLPWRNSRTSGFFRSHTGADSRVCVSEASLLLTLPYYIPMLLCTLYHEVLHVAFSTQNPKQEVGQNLPLPLACPPPGQGTLPSGLLSTCLYLTIHSFLPFRHMPLHPSRHRVYFPSPLIWTWLCNFFWPTGYGGNNVLGLACLALRGLAASAFSLLGARDLRKFKYPANTTLWGSPQLVR